MSRNVDKLLDKIQTRAEYAQSVSVRKDPELTKFKSSSFESSIKKAPDHRKLEMARSATANKKARGIATAILAEVIMIVAGSA